MALKRKKWKSGFLLLRPLAWPWPYPGLQGPGKCLGNPGPPRALAHPRPSQRMLRVGFGQPQAHPASTFDNPRHPRYTRQEKIIWNLTHSLGFGTIGQLQRLLSMFRINGAHVNKETSRCGFSIVIQSFFPKIHKEETEKMATVSVLFCCHSYHWSFLILLFYQ